MAQERCYHFNPLQTLSECYTQRYFWKLWTMFPQNGDFSQLGIFFPKPIRLGHSYHFFYTKARPQKIDFTPYKMYFAPPPKHGSSYATAYTYGRESAFERIKGLPAEGPNVHTSIGHV